jgi:CsoR family transcriptional regulator, copper-sensing transcriptional repressor
MIAVMGDSREPTMHPTEPTLPGYSGSKSAHVKRLRRIEGQIRGLERMVDSGEYCIDVLTQVSAATRALESFALSLLDEHLHHCVASAVERGGAEAQEKIEEASAAIARLVRS